ncbi:MAG: hypothetical protein ABSB58_06335 [Gemmatimonadales bacterium]|jgi:hypothetical protein
MPRLNRLVAFAALATLAACAPAGAPRLTDAHRAAIADSVRELANTMAAAVRVHGYRGFNTEMDSAPGYLWAYNGMLPFASFDSMAAWTRSEPEAATREVFAWDTLRIQVIAPGVAGFAAGYSETRPDSTGTPRTEKGIFTAVAVHRAGGWKFTTAHTSTLPPPPPPAPVRKGRK